MSKADEFIAEYRRAIRREWAESNERLTTLAAWANEQRAEAWEEGWALASGGATPSRNPYRKPAEEPTDG
jgi:hypothetical protein